MIAKDLEVHHWPTPIPIALGLGSCAIALTSSPFALSPPGALCYAILADWLEPSAPVGMLVTFRPYRPKGKTQPEREVWTVFAAEHMRGHCNADGETLPVTIGRWMFANQYLTLHSPDRTESGDRWAEQVGGELPPRDQMGTEDNAQNYGLLALNLLNEQAWPPAPWTAPTLD